MSPTAGDSSRIRMRLVFLSLLLVVAVMGFSAGPAFAHRESPAGPTDGVSFPTLGHGQMAIVAAHYAEILALADSQFSPDHTSRRLRNYISLQYAACLWGVAPASVTDEDSPFNECSHGYLSAAEALLLHLRTATDIGGQADALADRIDREMLVNDTAMVLCRYSDTPFNTADVVSPHWNEIPSHPPTLLALLGMAGILAGIAGGALHLRGQAAGSS